MKGWPAKQTLIVTLYGRWRSTPHQPRVGNLMGDGLRSKPRVRYTTHSKMFRSELMASNTTLLMANLSVTFNGTDVQSCINLGPLDGTGLPASPVGKLDMLSRPP